MVVIVFEGLEEVSDRAAKGSSPEDCPLAKLTRIEEEEELETGVVDGVELELGELHGERVELVGGGSDAQEGQSEQVEALSVGQLKVVRQVVVHPLVDVVEEENVGPGVLEEIHLVVDLMGKGTRCGPRKRLRLAFVEARGPPGGAPDGFASNKWRLTRELEAESEAAIAFRWLSARPPLVVVVVVVFKLLAAGLANDRPAHWPLVALAGGSSGRTRPRAVRYVIGPQ